MKALTRQTSCVCVCVCVEHEELTKVKNVNKIQFGKYVLDTWYFRYCYICVLALLCMCPHTAMNVS